MLPDTATIKDKGMRLILASVIALGITLAAAPSAIAQDKGPPPPAGLDDPPPAAQQQQPPAEPERPKPEVTRYGDWFVGCQDITVDDKTFKSCEMQQILEETSSGKAFIRISILYPRDSDKPVLRIITPIGVLLQAGLKIKIDDGRENTLPFAICIAKPAACVVELAMSNDMVAAMKRGNGGEFKLTFPRNQVVAAPFSLAGFTKSIGEIAPK
jgi:invasion protein IalB